MSNSSKPQPVQDVEMLNLASPAGGVADLVRRLRAMDYIHNRGPDYMPLEIPPSGLRLEAATALTTLEAERDEARRHIAAFKDNLEVAREAACKLEAERDALAEQLAEVKKIADELRQMIDAQMERTKP